MTKSAETTYRALIVNVMVAMMEVDGDIDEREIDMIGDICEEIVGFKLDAAIREKLINSTVVTRREVLDLVRRHGGRLEAERREHVLRAGLYVLEADARTAPEEQWFLTEVGLAFGMTHEEIEEILRPGRR